MDSTSGGEAVQRLLGSPAPATHWGYARCNNKRGLARGKQFQFSPKNLDLNYGPLDTDRRQ